MNVILERSEGSAFVLVFSWMLIAVSWLLLPAFGKSIEAKKSRFFAAAQNDKIKNYLLNVILEQSEGSAFVLVLS